MVQLLITLRYYAIGSYQMVLGDFGGVSTSSANKIIYRVTMAILPLFQENIHMPENEDNLLQVASEIYSMARIPRVVGLIDGTHIRILSPGRLSNCFS